MVLLWGTTCALAGHAIGHLVREEKHGAARTLHEVSNLPEKHKRLHDECVSIQGFGLCRFRTGGVENTLFWWAQWFLGPLDSSGSWQQTQTQWFECADTQTPPEGFGQSGIQRRARMLTQNEKGADGQTKKHLQAILHPGIYFRLGCCAEEEP